MKNIVIIAFLGTSVTACVSLKNMEHIESQCRSIADRYGVSLEIHDPNNTEIFMDSDLITLNWPGNSNRNAVSCTIAGARILELTVGDEVKFRQSRP